MLPNTPHIAFDVVRVMRREIYPPEPLPQADAARGGPAEDSGSDGGGGLLSRSVTAWQAAGRALIGVLHGGRHAPGRGASVATADCHPSTGA